MDTRKTLVKTDYLVPDSADYIRGPIHPDVGVSAITNTAATYTYPVSSLNRLIVFTDTQACAFSLPAATSVAAYYSVVPGDAFSSTILNVGTVAHTFAADTNLGIGTTMGHTTMASGLGTTFKYVVGGTIAAPTASAYVL